MKQRITIKIGLLLAIVFLLNGCLPGILISRKEPTAQGHVRIGVRSCFAFGR